MRAFLVIVALIAILAIVGWISFDTSGDRPAVTLEKPKIESDIDAMSETIKEAGEEIKADTATSAEDKEKVEVEVE